MWKNTSTIKREIVPIEKTDFFVAKLKGGVLVLPLEASRGEAAFVIFKALARLFLVQLQCYKLYLKMYESI